MNMYSGSGFSTSDGTQSLERKIAPTERDAARGYSVNIKQIVLAFTIEFLIIGLILTSQYLIAVEQGVHVFEALLFPVALAMVELARVPLAIAVRTQNSWNIKLTAAFGVIAAVVVTTFSLSMIAYRTFDPRLAQTNNARSGLLKLEGERPALVGQIAITESAVEQKQKDRDGTNDRIKAITSQLTAQPGQTCGSGTVPNPVPGGPPLTRQTCKENPVLKPLQAELASTRIKLTESEAALKQIQTSLEHDRNALVSFDEKLGKAKANYREMVINSQLHSYTAMLFRKDPLEVSDGEVKTLEWYLIIIPSIAAAFSSTLIAITAVRRIKPEPEDVTAIPDEAVMYLFGPLLKEIKNEARATVSQTMNASSTKNQSPLEPERS